MRRIGFAVMLMSTGCVPRPSTAPAMIVATTRPDDGLPVRVEPSPCRLGRLRPGQGAAARLTLVPRGGESVRVDRVESSCPCLSARGVPTAVGPGGSSGIDLVYDPAEEPDFRGGLAIDLVGRGADGGVVFRTKVEVEVRDADPPR